MGLAVLLVIFAAVAVGLVLLPAVQNFILYYGTDYGVDWEPLTAIVVLLPFGFLVLIFFGAIRWIGRM